jgi:hypothetical protein
MRKISVIAIFAIFTLAGLTFGETEESLICENRTLFYGLWKDAAFGKDPNQSEKAAWIVLDPDGSYSFQRWPPSAARNSEIWRGPIPDLAVALVHTHPVNLDEKPSRGDVLVAQKLRMDLYVISSGGIWSVDQKGHVRKLVASRWYGKGAG